MTKRTMLGAAISNDDTAPAIPPKPTIFLGNDNRVGKRVKRAYIRKYIQDANTGDTVFGTCPICGRENIRLTRDHIIPKWAYKRVPQISKGFMKELKKLFPSERNIQHICSECNGSKSGTIVVTSPLSHAFWTKVRDVINEALALYEKKTRQDT